MSQHFGSLEVATQIQDNLVATLDDDAVFHLSCNLLLLMQVKYELPQLVLHNSCHTISFLLNTKLHLAVQIMLHVLLP